MKSFTLVWLTAIAMVIGSFSSLAQANVSSSTPTATADEKQSASAEKHLKPILAALNLQDSAKEATVRSVMTEFFAAHSAWHESNDSKLKDLWNNFNHARSKKDKAGACKALADIDGVYASFKPQHDKLINGLSSALSPEQIKTVEDTLTVNKVKVTYDVYLQIFPTLTAEQKAVVLKDLEAARDEAVDAGSMAEKSAFFKKYKIKIEEEYLTGQGYNPQQARTDFAAKQKADKVAKESDGAK